MSRELFPRDSSLLGLRQKPPVERRRGREICGNQLSELQALMEKCLLGLRVPAALADKATATVRKLTVAVLIWIHVDRVVSTRA